MIQWSFKASPKMPHTHYSRVTSPRIHKHRTNTFSWIIIILTEINDQYSVLSNRNLFRQKMMRVEWPKQPENHRVVEWLKNLQQITWWSMWARQRYLRIYIGYRQAFVLRRLRLRKDIQCLIFDMQKHFYKASSAISRTIEGWKYQSFCSAKWT